MHHLSRLDKAFLRKGIQLSRANNIVSLSRPSGASARVLLPDELPLEEKAVTQLLDFAEVKLQTTQVMCARRARRQIFIPAMASPLALWWPQHRHARAIWR